MPFSFDSSYTYQAPEAEELIFRPVAEDPTISDIFGVKTGVKGRTGVHFLGEVEYITIADAGCSTTPQELTIPTVLKQWDPKDLEAYFKECWSNMRGKVLEKYFKPGNDKPDITDTQIEDYLIYAASRGVFKDLVRMAWFGDTAYSSGDLTGGSGKLPYFNPINGIWKRIFTGVTGSTIERVEITNNGTTMAAGQSVAILQDMFDAMPARLAGQENQLLVSYDFYTNYLRYLESHNLESSFQMMQSGVSTATFRGIPITVVREWRNRIMSELKGVNPTRAILTVKGNLQLGFDAQPVNAAGENPFESWYEKKDKTYYARTLYAADTQVADDGLLVVAY